PIANVVAIAGILFVYLASSPRNRDGAGRLLLALVGAACLSVACWIAVRLIPGPTTAAVVTAQRQGAAHGEGTATRPLVAKSSDAVYGEWGCEETKRFDTQLGLRPGEEFVSAHIDIIEIDKAKS